MNKKILVPIILSFLFITSAMPVVFAAYPEDQISTQASPSTNSEVKLTDTQKNEIKELLNKKIEIEKQIIQKYVDFGVIPKEKAELKLQHIDKMKDHMEKNGYVPKMKKDLKNKGKDQKQGQ